MDTPDRPAASDHETHGPGAPPPRRGPLRRIGRSLHLAGRGAIVAIAVTIAVVVVGVLSIDFGPALRDLAEREGAKQINRPLHLGRLSVNLLRGRFVVEDLRIEGLRPDDRPFFTARRLDIRMPWWSIVTGELFIESVVLSDWEMLVETFPGDVHNFIRIPRREPGGGPSRFVTTVQLVRAERGQFTLEDHGTPWSTIARNLDVTVAKLDDYRGEARFSGGTVQIQQFEPMWADMSCSFAIVDGKILIDRLRLDSDGATSDVTGEVDLARWPEQIYVVKSRVDFPRMRELFFAGDDFSLFGEGHFDGTFHLYKGGRELKGTFRSAMAGVNDFRFPDLAGALVWLPERFDVTEATSGFSGGRARFTYSMAPLGDDDGLPAIARFDATYEDVDLLALSDFFELDGIRVMGRARGRNLLEWPLGRFRDRRGEGEIVAAPPGDVALQGRTLDPGLADRTAALGPQVGPFNPEPLIAPVAVGGEIRYGFGPEWIEFSPSYAASSRTHVAFEGRTAYLRESDLPFHVTSADWQESDRLLAGILTAVGSPSRAVPIGGFGEFDGRMTGTFADSRIEGRFTGQAMRAFDVTWGRVEGDVVIEDAYATVSRAVVTSGEARMDVDGRFAIGYPRRDGGEEIDARVRIARWDVVDLRHAFGIDDYPVTGALSGEFHVYDRYEAPHGFGRLVIEPGVAYGQSFERGSAGLRFEGAGVRIDGIEIAKSTGLVTGAAFVGWDGTYSFSADGRRIPVEEVEVFQYPEAPLSGVLFFTASGTGQFESPRYETRARIEDLFLRDEGVGEVTARLSVRDQTLTIDLLEAASPRLAVSVSGRVALTPESDAELTIRFSETSIDPYVRTLLPQLSPFTTLVASGTIRVNGELQHREHVRAEAVVEAADLRLFDYRVQNDGNLRFAFDREVLTVDRLRLVGEGTELEMTGEVRFADDRLAIRGLGDANLGILQGIFRDLRSSGSAEVQAEVRGTLEQPVLVGSATVTDGRVRHFSLPHAIEALNGRVEFGADGVRFDGLTGRLGGGDVRFGGRLAFRGLTPGDYAVTAVGTNMRLRYPEGFRSLVDADLALRGDFYEPLLTGSVTVRSALWDRPFDAGGAGWLGLAGGGDARPPAPAAEPSLIPIRFDVRVVAPSTLRIENRVARLVSSAELTLRGDYDRPLLVGRVEVDRGEVLFEGNRYQVTRGTIDFANPTRIEPFFDIEAETRARVPGQVYRVTFRVSGTPDRFVFDLSSDPPLATVEILALLFGGARDLQDAELRALRSPDLAEQDLLATRAASLLASPIASGVGRVVEDTFGVDSVQITPWLGDLSAQQSARLNPSARLTIGKRISDRAYLTYSRALNASTRDQIILLEYNQSDRLAWIVSQNEDRTYAVDVLVRRVF